MDRTIAVERVNNANGHLAVQRITCGHPGCRTTIDVSVTGRRAYPFEALKHMAANSGWKIGPKAGKDRCPEHAHGRRHPSPKPKERTHVPEPKTIAPNGASEAAPRELTFTHKRIIISQLEDVYFDESSGYTKGWNDQRVAEHLSVPRAWVEKVRDANFGPAFPDTSEEVQQLEAQLRDATAKVQAAESRVGDVKATVDRLEQTIRSNAAACADLNKQLQEQVDAIRGTRREIAGLVNTIETLTGRKVRH